MRPRPGREHAQQNFRNTCAFLECALTKAHASCQCLTFLALYSAGLILACAHLCSASLGLNDNHFVIDDG
jgi:hypothetical protein